MTPTRTVRSIDGRIWTIRAGRFRPPKWRHSDYEPEADDPFIAVFEYLYAIVAWFIVPLLLTIVELPVACARSLFSSRRWIYASSGETNPITILWSTRRGDTERVAEEITIRLSRGYESLTPDGAELIEMSEPPGLLERLD